MRIYTRRGDQGETDLFGGARVSKASHRVRAYGAIDEANSSLGFVLSHPDLPTDLREPMYGIMRDLFDLSAELATAPTLSAQQKLAKNLGHSIDLKSVIELENYIDKAETELTPLTSFVLPTGTELAARMHLARTAVRQAEQEVVAVADLGESIRDELMAYLNRLSDLLFVWARLCNHRAGVKDILWVAKHTPPSA